MKLYNNQIYFIHKACTHSQSTDSPDHFLKLVYRRYNSVYQCELLYAHSIDVSDSGGETGILGKVRKNDEQSVLTSQETRHNTIYRLWKRQHGPQLHSSSRNQNHPDFVHQKSEQKFLAKCLRVGPN